MIRELHGKLEKEEVTKEELFEEAKTLAEKYQEEFNSFVTILDPKDVLIPF